MTLIGRTVAVAALVVAIALAAIWLVGSQRADYRVTARLQNASLLVKGNEVRSAGRTVGLVEDIRLTRDGQAAVELRIDDGDIAPLHEGTQAIVRQASLAGIANRYVDLRLGSATEAAIPDGGTIGAEYTAAAVEIDQIFDVFDERTRRALGGVIAGSARLWKGRPRQAGEGLLYLNPALAASERLLGELEGDTAALERFLNATGRLVTDVAAEREHLAPLVSAASQTAGALSNRRREVGDAIDQLPSVLRRSNTTFVNLRAALDDLDPLVDDARPAARALAPLARELRTMARNARPTLRDLARLSRAPGADNDVIDLLGGLQPLRDVAVRPTDVDGRPRPGAFPAATAALERYRDPLAFLRPYSVDLTGWFDDFGHSGVYDALGGSARIGALAGAFATLGGAGLAYVPPELRDAVFRQVAMRNQRRRCPGALERGAVWRPTTDHPCDTSQVPVGP